VSPHEGEAELVFNYRTRFNEIWDNRTLERKHGYRTRYPEAGADGVAVELQPR
jgi:hypothetical protein